MPTNSSSDADDDRRPMGKPFGRERPIHDVLGGGKVADVLLWRDKRVSASILTAISTIWFLLEVVQYSFVTLICHILIATLLVIFIWSMGSGIFEWPHPMILIPESIVQKYPIDAAILILAFGENFGLLIWVIIVFLWLLSVIGNYISTLNLLFWSCLCSGTLPYLYERYEEEVDDLVNRVNHCMRKSYKKFDSKFLSGKITREPVPEDKKAK